MQIKIGSEMNALAIGQAERVREVLEANGFAAAVYACAPNSTQEEPLSTGPGDSTWLFNELKDNKMDFVLVPANEIRIPLPQGLKVCAVLRREDPRDGLLSFSEEVDPENQNQAFRIGASSGLSKALLNQFMPAWHSEEIGLRVEDAILRMKQGEYDGLVFGLGGIKSLGIEGLRIQKMNPSAFSPSPGQGIWILAGKADDPRCGELSALLHHPPTSAEFTCEKSFEYKIRKCVSDPVFALATALGETVTFSGGILKKDGSEIIREEISGSLSECEAIGYESAEKVIQKSGIALR